MYTFPPHPAASAWLLNELHLYLPLYSEIVYGDIHYFGLQQKKRKKKVYYTKGKKKNVGFVKKKKIIKYTVGGLDCFCRAAKWHECHLKHQCPLISQHKEPRVKHYWSSLCVCAFVCMWLSVLLRECLIFHQHAWAFLVVHATSGTHHVCGNRQEAGRNQRMTVI